jgi:hypothetical protein
LIAFYTYKYKYPITLSSRLLLGVLTWQKHACLRQAWFIAGLFVLLALPVSIYEVAMQLEYFSRPKLQIRVIRILWMVPVYALDSWFALRFKARCSSDVPVSWHPCILRC